MWEEVLIMFERFTQKARRVVFFAGYEARIHDKQAICTNHLVLGVLREAEKLILPLLAKGDFEDFKSALLGDSKKLEKSKFNIDLPLSPESAQALSRANKIAIELRHNAVDAGHILLALLEEEDSQTAQILQSFIDTPQKVRVAVIEEYKSKFELISGGGSEIFYAQIQPDGTIQLPHGVILALGVNPGDSVEFIYRVDLDGGVGEVTVIKKV